jgi:RNA recognition motif-containing protein
MSIKIIITESQLNYLVTEQLESKKLPEHIIIGDSQAPYLDNATTKAQRISTKPGEESLWMGAQGVPWFMNAIKKFPESPEVKTVILCVGTNGSYGRVFKENIGEFFSTIRKTFPNAKILVVQGSWGWGGLKGKVTADDVKNYYKQYEEQGGIVIEPPIGDTELSHNDIPVYKIIGSQIDSIIE